MHWRSILSFSIAAVVVPSHGQSLGRQSLRGSFDDIIQLSDADDQFCGVDDAQRDECGYPGIHAAGCARVGCCWSKSDRPGAPWCFYNNNPVCAVSDADREECGYPGIKRDQCKKTAGCCWAKGNDSPWCFKEKAGVKADSLPATTTCKVDDTARRACGGKDINARDCHLQSCCYAPASEPGAPFCFHGEDAAEAKEVEELKPAAAKAVTEDIPADEQTCDIFDADRVECGFKGMGTDECISKGCCWKSSQLDGAPWCFGKGRKPNRTDIPAAKATKPIDIPLLPSTGADSTCEVPDDIRHECGFQGIKKHQCVDRGCCWVVAELVGAPWCFNATTKEELSTGALKDVEPLAEVENDAACQVPDAERAECGYAGMHHEQCIEKGCCWVPASDPHDGAPFCFNRSTAKPSPTPKKDEVAPEKNSDGDETCAVPDQGRTECGFAGIHSDVCLERGCCWKKSDLQGVPWCFGKATEKAVEETEFCFVNETQRHECGWDGMTANQCRERGCCWVPANKEGVPWCFREASKPKLTTAGTTSIATTSTRPKQSHAPEQQTEQTTTAQSTSSTALGVLDPDLKDFLTAAAPSDMHDTHSAAYRQLVSRCQGWLKKEFLTIEYLVNFPGNRQGTQNEFLKNCFDNEESKMSKGQQYFLDKEGGGNDECKWKKTWDKAGLELPISVGIVLLMLSIGVCQWRTEDKWAEETQEDNSKQEKKLNQAKAAAEQRTREKQAARDAKLTDFQKEQQRIQAETESKRKEVENRNRDKQQQRELRRQQEEQKQQEKATKKQARELEIKRAQEEQEEAEKKRAEEDRRQKEREEEQRRMEEEAAKKKKGFGCFGCGSKSGARTPRTGNPSPDSPSTASSSSPPPPLGQGGYTALNQGPDDDKDEDNERLPPIDEDEPLPEFDNQGNLLPPASRENSEDPGPGLGEDSEAVARSWYGPHVHRLIDYLCAAAVLIYTIHHSIAYGTIYWAAPFLTLSAACVLLPCFQYLNDLSFSQYITVEILLDLIAMIMPVGLRFFDFFEQPKCELPILYLYILEGIIAFDFFFFKFTNACCMCCRSPPQTE